MAGLIDVNKYDNLQQKYQALIKSDILCRQKLIKATIEAAQCQEKMKNLELKISNLEKENE